MLPDSVDHAARLLRDVRLRQELLHNLPEECRPTSLEEAYAIQDRLAELLGERIAGWLVGCTNQDIQRQLGLLESYTARLLASSLRQSPAKVRVRDTLPVVLEVEFAFTLTKDIPSRSAPYSEEEVAAAIGTVHPAIEMVLGHFPNWPKQDIFSLIADNGTDGPLILGAGLQDWQTLDLRAVPVVLRVNGQVVREGSGANVMSGPLSVMTWLANSRRRAPGLLAGQVINTGTCTSMYHAQHGENAIADFGPLGVVALEIAAPESCAN